MKTSLLALGLLLVVWQTARADRSFTVVTNSAVMNHWPGPDKFIGTSDDIVNAGLSTYQQSSPNSLGSYSYIVTTFGTKPDPWLFPPYDVITYVVGSASIDPTVFVTNNVPLLKSVQFSGTELFPGHGPYSVTLTSRVGGAPKKVGNLFTFSSQFDFQGSFAAGTAVATNATAAGSVVLLNASDFNAPNLAGVDASLAQYIQSVAIPLAMARQASGLLCGTMTLDTAGSVPGVPGDTGYFPPLHCFSVVLALDLSPAVASNLQIASAQLTPRGLLIQWNSLGTGATYSVEATSDLAAPFTVLSAKLPATSFVDATSTGLPHRFYRVSSP